MNSHWASKIRGVVVVEADDHPAPDLQARVLDSADPVDDRPAFARTFWYFFVSRSDSSFGALDADEDGRDVRLDHQLHQLVVLGQVERRLGEEA